MSTPKITSVTAHGREFLFRLSDGREFRYLATRDGRNPRTGIPGVESITAAGNDVVVVLTDGRRIRHRVGAPRPWDIGIGAGTGAAPGNYAPTNAAAPVISGSPNVGSTLTSTTGSWSANPTPTYTYQWTRNGSNIAGATSSTYVTQAADVGTVVRCVVTADNGIGSPGVAPSNGITVVDPTPASGFWAPGFWADGFWAPGFWA